VPGRIRVLVVEAGRGRFRVLTNGLQVVEATIQAIIGFQAASLLHAFGRLRIRPCAVGDEQTLLVTRAAWSPPTSRLAIPRETARFP
jgi:hypothetical protein